MQLFSYFLILSLLGSFLLQLPQAYVSGTPVPWLDSFFTGVSAVCVTGLSTIDMRVYTKVGFVFIALLIEFGGLGLLTYISLFMIIPSQKISLVNRRLVKDFFIDNVNNNPTSIIRIILIYTLTIQLIGAVCLMPFLRSYGIESWIFDSCFLSISAFCNAGFSVYYDSLARFNNAIPINMIISILIVLGGIGFVVLQNCFQSAIHKKKHLTTHTRLVLLSTLILIVVGAVVYMGSDYDAALTKLPFKESLSAALFESITTRTCGFETIPQQSFSHFSWTFTIFLMFVGGSPGSIAGGIKTTTLFVLLLFAFRGDQNTGSVIFNKRTIPAQIILKATSIVIKSIAVITVGIFLLCFTQIQSLINGDMTIFELMFETVSAFGTVGLSMGITGALTTASKIIIIFVMFAGRTAFVTMTILFPGQDSSKEIIRYPRSDILTG